jgi:TPR repeat protein
LLQTDPRIAAALVAIVLGVGAVGCATQQATESSTEQTEDREQDAQPVTASEAWPTECAESLEATGCEEALIEKHTREVCEKNSVATACVAGISLQMDAGARQPEQLREYAATACEEGMERGCLLEASFKLQEKTAKAYYGARETFRKLCSADDPEYCMAAGDALLSIGAAPEAARPFLDQACQKGFPAGCRLLGVAYERAGMDGSNAFEKGCFAGDVTSCKNLQESTAANPDWAMLPSIGMTRKELVDTAWKDCRAAKQPDCVLWAQIARQKAPPSDGRRLAERFWDVGCQAGAPDACFFYAIAVAHGFDGDPNPNDAARWRQKGCSMGWEPACVAPSVFVE